MGSSSWTPSDTLGWSGMLSMSSKKKQTALERHVLEWGMSLRLTLFLSTDKETRGSEGPATFLRFRGMIARTRIHLSSDMFSSLYQALLSPETLFALFSGMSYRQNKNNMAKNKLIISAPFHIFSISENEAVIHILWVIPHLNFQPVIKSYVSCFLNIPCFCHNFP